jgi:predicted dehydrogenase
MPSKHSPARRVKVAVVGLGFMGVTHLRAYQHLRHAQIVAVCDHSRPPLKGVVRGVSGNIQKSGAIHLGPGVKIYPRFEEILADPEVEMVDLCTPTKWHVAQATAALRAGKHVFCEKPLARSSAEARRVVQVAKTAGKQLMPAMCMRFWPGWDWLKTVVTQKKFGNILAANFRRISIMPGWGRPGTYGGKVDPGGALFDLHIHDTDFVYFLFGLPDSVFASGVTDAGGTINHVVTQYRYQHGPVIHAEGSWLLAQGFNMAYTLHCEDATIDFDLARGAGALRLDVRGKKSRTIPLDKSDGYAREVQYFLDCLRQGRPAKTVTAMDAVNALRICEAEEKSLRRGRPVKL